MSIGVELSYFQLVHQLQDQKGWEIEPNAEKKQLYYNIKSQHICKLGNYYLKKNLNE